MKSIALSDYNVLIGPIAASLKTTIQEKQYSKVGFIVDENTRVSCLPEVVGLFSDAAVIEIKSGEQNKTLSSCEFIWSSMADHAFDRHSLIINLGGGVIGDMGGFAASCFMRGIDFIQVPTTLLSQVDASVGGKLAVDFQGYKNYIGLFKNPLAVLVDPSFLSTLSDAQLRSGYAEMIKHGLIQDKVIWQRLISLSDWRKMDWEEEIYQSIQIKKAVVTDDPKEGGLRKILNFGHTIGHAIESVALESDHPLLHGEAIALGMIAEAHLGKEILGLSPDSFEEITAYIKHTYPDLSLDALSKREEIISVMLHDKKNKSGQILGAIIDGIGHCQYDVPLSQEQVLHSIDSISEAYNAD